MAKNLQGNSGRFKVVGTLQIVVLLRFRYKIFNTFASCQSTVKDNEA